MATSFNLLWPYYRTSLNKLYIKQTSNTLARTCLVLVLAILSSIGFYKGTIELLDELKGLQDFIYLPADRILALFLLFLFVTLTISNIAIALGRFYQSNDLELLLAAPVNFISIFISKFILVCWAASWMPLLFIMPVVIAFLHEAHNLSWLTIASCVVLLLPYFIWPTALAIILATVFLLIGTKNYSKTLVWLAGAGIAWLAWSLLSAINSNTSSLSNTQGIIKAIGLVTLGEINWLPSNWTGRSFNYILTGNNFLFSSQYKLLLSSALAITALAYIVLLLFFDQALAKERGTSIAHSKTSFLRSLLYFLIPTPKIRAMAIKEYAQVLRETSQLIQVLLLFALSAVYLYHLETLAFASQFSIKFELAWTAFLSITTLAVGCFFILAFTTRIVFPSISLEGKTFWYLMSKPITTEEFLRSKLLLWFIPIGILSTCFFVLGAQAIHLNNALLPIVALFGLVSAYGAVGTAIGLGAKFANFDWEYSSQLIASFGSILYMLVTTLLLTVGCIPLAKIIQTYYQPAHFQALALVVQILLIVLVALALWLPHVLAVRYAFKLGQQELKRNFLS